MNILPKNIKTQNQLSSQTHILKGLTTRSSANTEIEYLRCNNQDILTVISPNKKHKYGEYIRGRRFHFVMPWDDPVEDRRPNTSVFTDLMRHTDQDK